MASPHCIHSAMLFYQCVDACVHLSGWVGPSEGFVKVVVVGGIFHAFVFSFHEANCCTQYFFNQERLGRISCESCLLRKERILSQVLLCSSAASKAPISSSKHLHKPCPAPTQPNQPKHISLLCTTTVCLTKTCNHFLKTE